jgi:outer membrane lipoprotein carrier protein
LWPPFCFPRSHSRATNLPSAHELSQRVDRHYDQLQSLKAGFSESYAGLGMTKTESGTLFLRKPGRMMWQYSTPQGKIFLLDGKFAWFYTTGDAQVQRIPASELDDLRSPLRFLLGHTQLEKELTGLTVAERPTAALP